jgi:hypothetical protein
MSCLVAALLPGVAHAKAHLWKFTEFFSNADGSVQFIEMQVTDPAGTAEWQLKDMELRSNANVYIFPNHLPQENTFERYMLIATAAFAALPGAPTPDYVIPANFFDPTGDEILYRTFRDTFTIPAATMPTDGIHSLARDLSTPVNSPTNFAGDTGSVVAGAAMSVPSVWPGVALILLMTGLWAIPSRGRTHRP